MTLLRRASSTARDFSMWIITRSAPTAISARRSFPGRSKSPTTPTFTFLSILSQKPLLLEHFWYNKVKGLGGLISSSDICEGYVKSLKVFSPLDQSAVSASHDNRMADHQPAISCLRISIVSRTVRSVGSSRPTVQPYGVGACSPF